MSNTTKFEEITSSLISRRAFLKKSFSIGSLALMSTTLGSIVIQKKDRSTILT